MIDLAKKANKDINERYIIIHSALFLSLDNTIGTSH